MTAQEQIDALQQKLGELEKKVGTVENTLAERKGARLAMAYLGTISVAALIIGIINFFWMFVDSRVGIAVNATKIASLEAQREKDVARLERAIERLADHIQKRPVPMSFFFVEGTLVKVTTDKVVIRNPLDKDREIQLVRDVQVIIDNKQAKLADLRAGALVRVGLLHDGQGFLIEVLPPEPPIPPKKEP